MLSINDYKQLHDLMADELNVKNVSVLFADTDRGPVKLNYNRATREYTLLFEGEQRPARDEIVRVALGLT